MLTLAPCEDRPVLQVLLADEDPSRLPGDGLGEAEDLEQAAGRIMAAVGLSAPRHVEQLASFGDPHRTPPPRTVGVSYLALVPQPFQPAPGWSWRAVADAPDLVGDHDVVLAAGVQRVRSKLSYSTIAFGLLPSEFTMSELQEVYEAVLDTALDKRNFRRRVQSLGLVLDTGRQRRGSHRPAALYAFSADGLVLLDEVIVTG